MYDVIELPLAGIGSPARAKIPDSRARISALILPSYVSDQIGSSRCGSRAAQIWEQEGRQCRSVGHPKGIIAGLTSNICKDISAVRLPIGIGYGASIVIACYRGFEFGAKPGGSSGARITPQAYST